MSVKSNQKNNNQKKQSDKAKIRELMEENLRLRREIESLKYELQRSNPSTRRLLKKKNNVRSIFFHQSQRAQTYAQENYFSYFSKSLKNASFFRIYADILSTVKRLSFVTTTIQIVLILLVILKSAAIFLISTSAFIIAMPFIIIISGVAAVLSVMGSKKATAQNLPLIEGKDVYVFFPAKKSIIQPNSYFAGFVRSIAEQDENRVCIIITQGFFFSRGIGAKKRYYFTSRQEANNIIIVRRHYYFRLKNKVIIPKAHSINEIY